MKQSSRERLAALLMDELLARISERENIKKMLGDMSSLPVDELVEKLVADFERTVEVYRRESIEKARSKPNSHQSDPPRLSDSVTLQPLAVIPPAPPAPPPTNVQRDPVPASEKKETKASLGTEERPVQSPTSKVDNTIPLKRSGSFRTEEPILPLHAAEKSLESLRHEFEELERMVQAGMEKSVHPTVESSERFLREMGTVEFEADESWLAEQRVRQVKGPEVAIDPSPSDFTEEDLIYLHAVGSVPANEEESKEVMLMEEKGIDGRMSLFALDHSGLRFYLSKIQYGAVNISKTGVLLLAKGESIEMRGAHHRVLNDLRMHGVLVPVAFGTVVKGMGRLKDTAERVLDKLKDALEAETSNTVWTLTVSALDARIARVAGTDASGARRGRESERTSHTQAGQRKKYDVKQLEKILQREKKLAESIHEALEKVAESAETEMMVGLASGSSDDWKPILKATYEVPWNGIQVFNGTISDLQHQHILYDLMFSLSGETDEFTFS